LSLSGLKWIALLVFVAALLPAGFAADNAVLNSSVTTTTIYQTITVTQTVTMATSTATTGWREVKRFAAASDMTTEPFSVPSTMWRIKWSYGNSQFALFDMTVYTVGQAMWVESVGPVQTPAGSGITYIYKGPGDFYLKISVANAAYIIIVEVPG
jgi:hypothetical protein